MQNIIAIYRDLGKLSVKVNLLHFNSLRIKKENFETHLIVVDSAIVFTTAINNWPKYNCAKDNHCGLVKVWENYR